MKNRSQKKSGQDTSQNPNRPSRKIHKMAFPVEKDITYEDIYKAYKTSPQSKQIVYGINDDNKIVPIQHITVKSDSPTFEEVITPGLAGKLRAITDKIKRKARMTLKKISSPKTPRSRSSEYSFKTGFTNEKSARKTLKKLSPKTRSRTRSSEHSFETGFTRDSI